MGTANPVDEVGALASIAHDHGLRVHVDGARIANALAALGASLAELTWRAGVVLPLASTLRHNAVRPLTSMFVVGTAVCRDGGVSGRRCVGTAGFEPTTPCSQSRCATKLRHVPCRTRLAVGAVGPAGL